MDTNAPGVFQIILKWMLTRWVCFFTAGLGFLLAVYGMFQFHLTIIFLGLAIYILGVYLWDEVVPGLAGG